MCSDATSHQFKSMDSEVFTLSLTTPQLTGAESSSLCKHENLVELQELHPGAILYSLKQRYAADEIYTALSSILLSTNPYKPLSLYGPSTMSEYRAYFDAPTDFPTPLPPHVYEVADRAYRLMRDHGEYQAIIISGESGSGKDQTH
jgi:myosin heavy subunit